MCQDNLRKACAVIRIVVFFNNVVAHIHGRLMLDHLSTLPIDEGIFFLLELAGLLRATLRPNCRFVSTQYLLI